MYAGDKLVASYCAVVSLKQLSFHLCDNDFHILNKQVSVGRKTLLQILSCTNDNRICKLLIYCICRVNEQPLVQKTQRPNLAVNSVINQIFSYVKSRIFVCALRLKYWLRCIAHFSLCINRESRYSLKANALTNYFF